MSRNSLNLERLSDSETELFETILGQIEGFPDSIRLFKELHHLSLNVLKHKGKRVRTFPRVLEYVDFDTQTNFAIELKFTNNILADHLDITYNSKNNVLALYLSRIRGYMSQISGSREMSGIAGVLIPKPYKLGISSNGSALSVIY